MKTILTILGLSISLFSFGQCDQLEVVQKDFTITTTTPSKIKEFSLSKIWFSDYTPPTALIYLFLQSEGDYLEPAALKELSQKDNVIIHFTDSTTLKLRAIIGTEYAGDNVYEYQTVIYLTNEYINLLANKHVVYFELFSFTTNLSERKSKRLYEYLNCMIVSNK